MEVQEITPSRELPKSDLLFQVSGGPLVRVRVTQKTTDGLVRDMSEPGAAETVNVKFQCSLAKDDSGDVRKDAAGNHLLLAAEVHSVSAEALVNGKVSFDAWLAERVDEAIKKAAQKAYVLDRVLARFAFQ